MKFLNTIFMLLLFFPVRNFAQESDFILENLKAPSMPSAVILGAQIDDINIPKSLKEFEAAFFTNYLNSDMGFTIPNNYALEINPFMLSGRKNFDYKSYLENEPASNIWRNLSASVATTNQFISGDSVLSNAVGFSLRTIILNGECSEEVSEAFTVALSANQYLNDMKAIIPLLIRRCINNNDSINIDSLGICVSEEFEKEASAEEDGIFPDEENTRRKILLIEYAKGIIVSVFLKIDDSTPVDQIAEVFDEIYKEDISLPALNVLKQELTNVKTNRYGFRLDFNWALALDFPTDNFTYSIIPRWGSWINLSYQSEDIDFLNIIALGRFIIINDKFSYVYESQEENFDAGNNYDLGLKFAADMSRFFLSAECIYRINTNKITKLIEGEEYERSVQNNTWKYLISLNYNITDNINLSYSLGKNFNSNSPPQGDLISGLSINFGFGDIKASELLSSGSE